MFKFETKVLSIACDMVQTSSPENLCSPLYKGESKNCNDWWLDLAEARLLCERLSTFLSTDEEALDGIQRGKQLCDSMLEKLE